MKKSILLLVFFLLTIMVPPVYSIDTDDWEGILGLQLFGAKPEKEWLLNTAAVILYKAYTPNIKKAEYFNKYYDSKSNSLTIPLKNKWHDIEMMHITYSRLDKENYYTFGVIYKFKKGTIGVLDVIGRYGVRLAEIKTNNDLSKDIIFKLNKNSSINYDHPLRHLMPLHDEQITMLTFHSANKVFIDTLAVGSVLKIKNQTPSEPQP